MGMEERRDYKSDCSESNSWKVEERNNKRNLQGLNKGVKSQEDTRQSHERGVQLWSLSLALQGPPHQDPSYTLLEGEDCWIERIEWQWRRRKILRDRGRRGNGVSPRNSTLDMEEYEGIGRGTSRNKRSVTTDKGELWIGEEGVVREGMGYRIVSRKGGKPFLRYWRGNIRGRRRKKNRGKVWRL